MSRRLGIGEFFNVESVKAYIVDLSKREKPPWTKFCKKPWPKKKRKANICPKKAGGRNLEIKPTRANSWRRPRCFWIALGWLDVWFFGGRHNFSSLSLISAFSLYRFSRSFSCCFPRNQWAIFVAGARGVRSSCFIGRRPDPVDRSLGFCRGSRVLCRGSRVPCRGY